MATASNLTVLKLHLTRQFRMGKRRFGNANKLVCRRGITYYANFILVCKTFVADV